MDTTADLAEAGRKPPGMQSLRAARQAREARIKFWRVFVVSSFFVVVLSANLFVGAVVMSGSIRTHFNSDKAEANGLTAQVRRPLLDGTFCRNIVFDNKTAQSIEDKVERCNPVAGKPKERGKSQFIWGGR